MSQVTGVTWKGEGQDDNGRHARRSVQRPRGGVRGGGAVGGGGGFAGRRAGAAAGGGGGPGRAAGGPGAGGGGDRAGGVVARGRGGERVARRGRDGLLSGLIGQVLQAGLGLELEEHLAAGDGNGRNGFRARTLSTEADRKSK